MEEPTYEESDLDELLEAEEEVAPEAAEEEFPEAEAFEAPYVAPVAGVEARVGALPVVLLFLTLIVLFLAGLFVVENGMPPSFSTHLTSWAPFGPK